MTIKLITLRTILYTPSSFKMDRITHFATLCSTPIMNNQVVCKFDLIGHIRINGYPVLYVYRRYNSTHNIVLESMNGFLYFQMDQPWWSSLQEVYQKTEEQMNHLYVSRLYSILYQDDLPIYMDELKTLSWAEVQRYFAMMDVDITDHFEIFTENTQFPVLQDPLNTAFLEDTSEDEDEDDASQDSDSQDDVSRQLFPALKDDAASQDDYADLPPLIMDSDEDTIPLNQVIEPNPPAPKRTFSIYSSDSEEESDASQDEEDEDAEIEWHTRETRSTAAARQLQQTKQDHTELRNGKMIPKRESMCFKWFRVTPS